MFCSISGAIPEEPVVDKSTGHLYEKRLIHKYVQETGQSPVTGESLALDDLLQLNSSQAVKPRPSPATSIPGLLGLFHNEWDAVMLEVHTLRKELGTVRQELSQALYQHDASVRVVARLQRELKARDDLLARMSAQQVAPSLNGGPAQDAADGQPAPKRAKAGITEDVVAAVTALSQTLSKGRKKRQISQSVASVDDISDLKLEQTYPLHKTTQGGILALDFESGNENVVYTAGVDHTGQVYDRAAGRVLSSLRGHSKKVTDIKVLGKHSAVVTASADKSAILWHTDGEKYSIAATLKDHSAEVSAITVQQTGDYFVTASLDKTWAFYDIASATCLKQVSDDSIDAGYTAVQYHPDGLLLGTGGQDSAVRIWETRQQKTAAKLMHTSGSVTSISFSENGYYVAAAAGDGAKIWDLRKLALVRELQGTASPTSVAFDQSGLYLAVGGSSLDIHGLKQDWSVVKSFEDLPKKGVFCAKWGTDARSLLVGAGDHNLRLYTTDQAVPMEAS